MKKLIFSIMCSLLLAGCSNEGAKIKNLDLVEVKDEMEEKYVDTFMVEVSESDVYGMFEITPDQVKQIVYVKAFLDVKCDELAMIQVKDMDEMENMKAVLQNRQNEIVKEFTDYIDSEATIAKQGVIFEKDNYLFMIINENATQIQADIELKLE